MAQVFQVELTQEKLTKRTVKFAEVVTEGDEKIGTLYVQQAAFKGKNPAKIRVRVEVIEE